MFMEKDPTFNNQRIISYLAKKGVNSTFSSTPLPTWASFSRSSLHGNGKFIQASDIAPSHQRDPLFWVLCLQYNCSVQNTCHQTEWALNDRQSTSGENYKYELDWWAFLSIRHLPPLPLWETNGNLEWKPNTNKVNRVNSNRQKKSSGRHLVSRSAPCTGFHDDRKKQQVKDTSGKNWRKNLKGKLRGTTIARIFFQISQSWQIMHKAWSSERIQLLESNHC